MGKRSFGGHETERRSPPAAEPRTKITLRGGLHQRTACVGAQHALCWLGAAQPEQGGPGACLLFPSSRGVLLKGHVTGASPRPSHAPLVLDTNPPPHVFREFVPPDFHGPLFLKVNLKKRGS